MISLPELPATIAAPLLSAAKRSPHAGKAIVELDTEWALDTATDYLRKVEPAVTGDAGDNHTIRVANRVLDFGVSPETALDLMLTHWNPRCSPTWDADRLEYKVNSAACSRQEPIGRDHPARVFEPVPPPPSGYLRFVRDVSIDEIAERRSRALVRGVLHPGDAAVAYGESTAGKTFVMLDMAYHIAMGKTWHGHKVTKAPVLYVCLEGVDGFELRMLAAAQKLEDPGNFFARLAVNVTLINDANGEQGVATILAAAADLAQRAGLPVGLVIIDTLARATAGGDENAVADMMAFVEKRMKVIQTGTGAATLAVHHPNKSGTIRGSSSLFAAMDVVIRFERDKTENTRSAIGEKVKDGLEGPLFNFVLDVVDLKRPTDPLDLDSKLTSCVVRAVPFVSETTKARKRVEACAVMQLEMFKNTTEELHPTSHGARYFPEWMLANQPDEFDFTFENHKAAFAKLITDKVLDTAKSETRTKGGNYNMRVILTNSIAK